jgi:hypothetical protein
LAKPRGESAGKSTVFSTRITPELRRAIERAAAESGRSLSQEIEFRLRRSFDEDAKIVEIFGGQQIYALMRLIGCVLTMQDRTTSWLSDQVAFDLATHAIGKMLKMFRPGGGDVKEITAEEEKELRLLMDDVLRVFFAAKPEISVSDKNAALMSRIRAGLGPELWVRLLSAHGAEYANDLLRRVLESQRLITEALQHAAAEGKWTKPKSRSPKAMIERALESQRLLLDEALSKRMPGRKE